jgi:triacylglycerol esterase/lipase EstA (alpha/beta hydrolase family)
LNFVQALIDAGAPFDCSIDLERQATIPQGAQRLRDQLTPILNSFGTRYVNLVVHSKGGLFARLFLQKNYNLDSTKQVGVISLTTLDTPHWGSVLADTVKYFNSGFSGMVIKILGPDRGEYRGLGYGR